MNHSNHNDGTSQEECWQDRLHESIMWLWLKMGVMWGAVVAVCVEIGWCGVVLWHLFYRAHGGRSSCATYTARCFVVIFFFSSRRRHTRFKCDWSSDVCSSD